MAWERMIVDGAPDATTFKMGGPELQTVRAVREKGGEWDDHFRRGWAHHSQDD